MAGGITAAGAGEDASVLHHPHANINQDQICISGLTNADGCTQVVSWLLVLEKTLVCLITLTRTSIRIRSI